MYPHLFHHPNLEKNMEKTMPTVLEVVRPPPPQNNKFIHMGVVVVPNHQELISPHLHEIISKHSNHHPK